CARTHSCGTPPRSPSPYWLVVREFARCGFGKARAAGKTTRGAEAPGVRSEHRSIRRRGLRTARGGAVQEQPTGSLGPGRAVTPGLDCNGIQYAAAPDRPPPLAPLAPPLATRPHPPPAPRRPHPPPPAP